MVFSITLAEGLLSLGVMALGFALRAWAAAALGRHYTSTLTTTKSQETVTTGPCALLRNPGYLGSIFLWTGFGALSANFILLFVIPISFVSVYVIKIGVEERMLTMEFGEDYILYMRRTHRLIPQ